MRRWRCFAPAQFFPACAFAKLALQATTTAAIDAAARLDRDWLSRGMPDPASPRAHALRYRELKGGRSPGAARLKNSRHRLVRVMHVGSAATEKVRSYLNCRRDAVAAQTSRRAKNGSGPAYPNTDTDTAAGQSTAAGCPCAARGASARIHDEFAANEPCTVFLATKQPRLVREVCFSLNIELLARIIGTSRKSC